MSQRHKQRDRIADLVKPILRKPIPSDIVNDELLNQCACGGPSTLKKIDTGWWLLKHYGRNGCAIPRFVDTYVDKSFLVKSWNDNDYHLMWRRKA